MWRVRNLFLEQYIRLIMWNYIYIFFKMHEEKQGKNYSREGRQTFSYEGDHNDKVIILSIMYKYIWKC
jgi:hypothetical protein